MNREEQTKLAKDLRVGDRVQLEDSESWEYVTQISRGFMHRVDESGKRVCGSKLITTNKTQWIHIDDDAQVYIGNR